MKQRRADATLNLDLSAPLLIGFGVTGQAVARALVQRGLKVRVVDDRPNGVSRDAAGELGLELLESPSDSELESLISETSALLPSPGVGDQHPCFRLAGAHGVPVAGEFDLAQMWDDRPLLAVTGTNGKTTVTELVAKALSLAAITAVPVGNTDVPLVTAIDNPATDVFVVEASSFRLGYSYHFSPDVACWLNFAPDHLDAHATLEDYRKAKASVWLHHGADTVAIANADDPVVLAAAPSDAQFFSLEGAADATWRKVDDELVGPGGSFVKVSELPRSQPHDLSNALAVAAVASAGGADIASVAATLKGFVGFAHRLELVGRWHNVAWYNDSKATVPHAALSAIAGFESVVLIAGGRNKGLDLDVLSGAVPPVHTVVAIGEAGPEIEAAFAGKVPVSVAASMAQAIDIAASASRPGDAVLLSPGCASFDWYSSYRQRGEEFCALVRQRQVK